MTQSMDTALMLHSRILRRLHCRIQHLLTKVIGVNRSTVRTSEDKITVAIPDRGVQSHFLPPNQLCYLQSGKKSLGIDEPPTDPGKRDSGGSDGVGVQCILEFLGRVEGDTVGVLRQVLYKYRRYTEYAKAAGFSLHCQGWESIRPQISGILTRGNCPGLHTGDGRAYHQTVLFACKQGDQRLPGLRQVQQRSNG